eukprot:363494-Chlamydomonas_euryale.AAC.2
MLHLINSLPHQGPLPPSRFAARRTWRRPASPCSSRATSTAHTATSTSTPRRGTLSPPASRRRSAPASRPATSKRALSVRAAGRAIADHPRPRGIAEGHCAARAHVGGACGVLTLVAHARDPNISSTYPHLAACGPFALPVCTTATTIHLYAAALDVVARHAITSACGLWSWAFTSQARAGAGGSVVWDCRRPDLSPGTENTFRAQFPDVVVYTYYSHRFNARATNRGWRLDYFLASTSLAPHAYDSFQIKDWPASDHTPLGLVLTRP